MIFSAKKTSDLYHTIVELCNATNLSGEQICEVANTLKEYGKQKIDDKRIKISKNV